MRNRGCERTRTRIWCAGRWCAPLCITAAEAAAACSGVGARLAAWAAASVVRAEVRVGERRSQRPTVPSREPEATAQGAPSLVLTLLMLPVWPLRLTRKRRVSTSQTRQVWSPLPVTSRRPPSHQARSKTAFWWASHWVRPGKVQVS